MIIVLFCVGSLKITEPDYESYFSWPAFSVLHAIVMVLLFKAVKKYGQTYYLVSNYPTSSSVSNM